MGTEESDQLPEEGADEYTPDDSADRAPENEGGADKGDEGAGDATGNPANAG